MRIVGMGGVLGQPFPEDLVEGFLLGPGQPPGLFNSAFIGAKCNVFHTKIVYTILV